MKRLLIPALFFAAASLYGDVWMPRIFSDNMVLQRDVPVKVWGTALANSQISAEFAGKSVSVKADTDGAWALNLEPSPADSTPRKLAVLENGKTVKEFFNVLVGDVWVAGGQSNMAFGISGIDGGKEFMKTFAGSSVRYFDHPGWNPNEKVQKDFINGARWIAVNPTHGGFSAVAMIFAKKLSDKLGIPIGVLYTALPGSTMRAWVPREYFDSDKGFSEAKKLWDARLAKWDYSAEKKKWDEFVAGYPKRVAEANAKGLPVPPKWTISDNLQPWESSPDGFRTPGVLYNARIAPGIGYAVKGILWTA